MDQAAAHGPARDRTADERSWDGVVILYARVEQQLAKSLQRRLGLGLSEYRALRMLAASSEGSMRIRELADAVGLNQSSVSRLAAHLEEAGLIRRVDCDTDRRGVFAAITEEGRRDQEAGRPVYREALAKALDDAGREPALSAAVQALRSL